MGLFDVKQFEQFFNEKTLKKGLKLFEKNELELIERSAPFEYHFLVSVTRLHLRKKGDNLLSYICACNMSQYCEHLCAAMFYFQQEALGIIPKNIKKNKLSGALTWNKPASERLIKAEQEDLRTFVKENKSRLTSKQIATFLASKSHVRFFDVYCMQVSCLVERQSDLKKMDQQHINILVEELKNLTIHAQKEIKKENERVTFYLAMITGLMPVFNLRFTGIEKSFIDFYNSLLEKADVGFVEGLATKQKEDWYLATEASLASNKHLQSEAFMFLVPRFLSFAKNESELLALNRLLKRRVYKTHYSQQLDKLLIVHLEVALKEWKLFKTAFPLHLLGSEVELIVAKCELDFFSNNVDRAFELLETNYENVRTIYKNYYNDYLDYILTNAKQRNKKEVERKYLRDGFLYRLFILPNDLDRFLELTPKADQLANVEQLIEELKTSARGYYFEKITVLLLKINKLDELIRELGKQSGKYTLIHEIALKKYPDYTDAFLTLYMKHLLETLRFDSFFKHQLKIFETAKVYLDKLPPDTVIELIKKLLDQIGKTGHLYRYLDELYDYPFLKEEENF